MSFREDRELFLAFQERWNIDKVKKMTLDEYTSTKALSNNNRDDFTFWIENKLEQIGSIWGGSSFKFGIYRQNNNEEKRSGKTRCYDECYGWLLKYGNNVEEAFNKIKSLIIEVITASLENNLKAIDNIDLGDAFKWKIAFHYQNINDIKIVDIFQSSTLKRIAENYLDNKKLSTSEIHQRLLADKTYTLETMRDEKAIPLWDKYGESMLELFKEYLAQIFDNKNTQNSYYSHMKTLEKRYSLKLEDCKFPEIFLEIKMDLENSNEFKTFNTANNNAYSNALRHYYDFLLNYTNNDTDQDENDDPQESPQIKDYEGNMTKQPPLNQILYGSPGTGKTYSTIDKALEILGVNTKSKSRQELKTLFEDYKSKGQIEFVTFHQSYGYEEFVEGIKPKLSDNETNELDYKIKDGIFKTICNREKEIDLNIKLWRLYTLPNADQKEDYFDECIKENFVYAYQNYGMEALEQEVKNGDYIIIPSAKSGKRQKSIRAFGILGDLIENTDKNRGFRKVEWKWVAKNEKEELFFEQADFRIAPFCGVEKEKELILKTLSKQTKAPYILIIDEINRGNISKIFGELITLIEPSKRIGAEEELRVTLPYSQTSFGVPSNLYIIGTMNTADRSITSLDTALRRRFEFVEMMPDATKLETFVSQGKTIDLQKMLTAINERIEFLYDREKTIGHAYLLDIKNLDDLKEAFQNKIIPLLQEYFYNDYEAIQAVLNDNGMVMPKQANKQKEQSGFLASNGFKNLVNDRGLEEKRIFKIAPKDSLNENGENLWNDPQTYINIYEG